MINCFNQPQLSGDEHYCEEFRNYFSDRQGISATSIQHQTESFVNCRGAG